MPIDEVSPEQWLLIIAGVVIVLAFLWLMARRGAENANVVGLAPKTPMNVDDEIRRLVAENKKIHAVKLYVDTQGVTLQEAKEYIDALEREGVAQASAPADVQAEIQALLSRGNKIEAIKRLRDATGLGLKEAKDAIDALERGSTTPAGMYANLEQLLQDRPGVARATLPSPADVDAHIQSYLRDGKKIEAIKLYHEVTGLGLKEAKDHVDAVERAMRL